MQQERITWLQQERITWLQQERITWLQQEKINLVAVGEDKSATAGVSWEGEETIQKPLIELTLPWLKRLVYMDEIRLDKVSSIWLDRVRLVKLK